MSIKSIFSSLFSTVRYRFFFFAGIFPYLLGQTIAFHTQKSLNGHYFWLGFLGILLVLIGVELFNEYFDAKEGGDRIFSQEPIVVPHLFFSLGILVFSLALLIGLYFTFKVGWLVFLFSLLGFLGAYFYIGPPIRWAYKGLGELVIALSYGPFMIFGSYYIQTGRIDFIPVITSLICALAIFSLALINEVPDYIQDKLVGKRNIVVRLGPKKAMKVFSMSMTFMFSLLAFGAIFKRVPLLAVAAFLMLPRILQSLKLAHESCENPKVYLSVVNTNCAMYLLIMLFLSVGYLID